MAGIVAALPDINCLLLPNLNGFELQVWVILDCCSDARLFKYPSNQTLPHTILVATKSRTAEDQVSDSSNCKTISLLFCKTSLWTIIATSSRFLSGHWAAQWLMFWQMLHQVGCPFLRGVFPWDAMEFRFSLPIWGCWKMAIVLHLLRWSYSGALMSILLWRFSFSSL